MQELDKLFRRIQTRQVAGKAIKEMKYQLIQQAVWMEDAQNKLAKALMRQKLECGSIQQYRARVVKLRTLQEPRPGIDAKVSAPTFSQSITGWNPIITRSGSARRPINACRNHTSAQEDRRSKQGAHLSTSS